MAQMFNPSKQWQAFKQGSIDPANPLADKVAKIDPLNEDRKRLMAYEQPEVKAQTATAPGVQQASGALGAAGDNVTVPTTMTKKPKSVAASALLNP